MSDKDQEHEISGKIVTIVNSFVYSSKNLRKCIMKICEGYNYLEEFRVRDIQFGISGMFGS
jgi:hypothetical protein